MVIPKYEELSSTYGNKIVLVRGKKLLQELKAMPPDKDFWKEAPFSPIHFIHAKTEMSN
ncbi:hypothetical protein D3C76_1698290 [compost metagenome]